MKLSLFLFSAAIGSAFASPPPTLDNEGFELAMRFSDDSEFVFCSSYWTDTELLDENDPDENKNQDGKFHPFVETVASKIKGCFGPPAENRCKTYDLDTPMTLRDLFKYTPIGSEHNLQFSVNVDEVLEWDDISQTTLTTTRGWYASGINFFDDVSVCPSNVRFGALFNNENTISTTNDAIGFGATECGNHQFGGGTKVGSGVVVFRDKKDPIQGRIYVLPAEDQTGPGDLGDPADDFSVCPGPGFSDACKATAWGDPHIVTWDGLKFDAQPTGEAIFLQSTPESGSTLSIHARIERARDNQIPAVTTGITTRGDDETQPIIQVAIASEGGEMVPAGSGECPIELLVNGERQESIDYYDNGVKVRRVGSTISIVYDELLRVDMRTAIFGKCYFTSDFYLFDCDAKSDSVIGLLGSPNGNPNDDWMTQEGEVLDLPADVSKYFYGPAFNYVLDNWIITEEDDSLFNYDGDQGFSTFSDPEQQYDPEYEESINNVSEEIIEICGDDVGCRIDGDGLGPDAAEDFLDNPASQRTPGSRVDDDGFELAMRFGTESEFYFCSSYWTDNVLLDENDHSATKDADGKFAPFVNTVASHIKGCLPGGCKVYKLPTPMTLKDLFTNTPIGSEENIQFSVKEQEALEWEYIMGQSITLETGWYATGINYFDDVSNCPSKVRFGGLYNNEGTISTTNDAVGFGATECGNTDVGAGAALWSKQRFPTMGTIWVKAARNPPPQVETPQPPAESPANVCGSHWTTAPTLSPTEPRTDEPTTAPSIAPVAPTTAPSIAPVPVPVPVVAAKFQEEVTGGIIEDDKGGKGGKGVGSGSGDPHFKTWSGDKYDYHGECDLVLVDHPSFAGGLGLRIHIRTTRVKYFSYISNIAVQIGDEVLEFDNDVKNFLINGETTPPQQKYVKTMLSGYHVRRDPKAISIRFDDQIKAKIDLIQRKTGWPAVVVDGATTDIFKGSLGLLGDWENGKRLARDGKTVMDDPDATAFALEWQVRDTEPMLFKEARFPQYPTTCTPPAKNLSKRLGVSTFEKEAQKACAHWKEDIEDCIFDVIATRDVGVAVEGQIGASVA